MKTCSKCGAKISKAQWEAMPLVGHQVFPPYEDDPGEVLEMKNHDCGSTLTILEPFTALELEREVDLIRSEDPTLSVKHARQLAIQKLHRAPDYDSRRRFGAVPRNKVISITCSIGQHEHCAVTCACPCHLR